MAKHDPDLSQTPPRLAERIIGMTIPVELRDPILGDFCEEYNRLSKSQSAAAAKTWYWRQAAVSLPHFIFSSLRSRPVYLNVASLIMAFLALQIWLMIAFRIFSYFYALDVFHGSVVAALSVRLAIETFGFLIAGSLIQYAVFKKTGHAKARANILLFLFALVLVAPSTFAVLQGRIVMPLPYLIARALIIVPALFTGAAIQKKILNRKTET